MSAALFSPAGGDGAWAAAECTRGPWDAALMHGGAPSALVAREAELAAGGEGTVVTRLTVEFLGGVPVGDVAVAATLARPGRRLQLVEATLDAGGRRALLARAVRLRRGDTAGAAARAASAADRPPQGTLPPPGECEPLELLAPGEQETFHPHAVEILGAGGEQGVGAAAAWFRLRMPVVEGEEPSPLQRTVTAADFANGLSWVLPWDDWLFVNTELTVHLAREPEGEWIGLDARTAISALGTGLATATLHDHLGPVGTCAQALFVDRR